MSAVSLEPVIRSLDPLSVGYHDLFERLVSACEPDQRIRALWLAGSVGREVADAGSDLDVVVTVTDADVDDFRRQWREWLATVTPTVIAREIPGLPGSFYSVTPGCERFDVVVEPVSDFASAAIGARLVVLDRDGLAETTGEPGQSAPGPDPTRLAAIVEEFFRQQAIFPAAVVARRDWLLGVVGVVATQRMLYDLFVEANQPLPMMGIKQWSARLTASQRDLLESLPVPEPRPAEVIAAMLAVRRAMLTSGRETAERYGLSWPVELAAAVETYFTKELGTSSASVIAEDPDSPSSLRTSRTTRIDRAGE